MRLWPRRSETEERTPTSPPGPIQARVNFAASLEEAVQRFDSHKSDDPFPEIPPALLNSADIADYVAATGMIYPFDPSALKTASYSVPLLGEAIYWDANDQMHAFDVQRGTTFRLKSNSIAFVTLEPEFHLPDYIAIRFNLKIPNVYKGLLLGTGPLVDPGWEGRLSMPLHNLTTNPYDFVGGEGLIWMEFTKLSPNQRWAGRRRNAQALRGEYVPFPEEKKFGSVWTRLRAATDRPVSSSLGAAYADAHDAVATARTLSNRIQWGGAIATIVGLGVIVALAVDVLAYRDNGNGSKQPSVVVVDQAKVRSLDRQIAQLREQVTLLQQKAGKP